MEEEEEGAMLRGGGGQKDSCDLIVLIIPQDMGVPWQLAMVFNPRYHRF